MDRQSFTELIQTKFKMVRIEAGYTQDTMALTIGLSKKTLVQIEKERVLPNWTTCVSICALFRDSEVLNSTFGCDPLEIIQTISRNQAAYPKHSTVSDIYWDTLDSKGGFILQANKVSELYRVLDTDKQPVFGTPKLREAETYFQRHVKEDLIRA
ncbi:transcriptional regulator [Staphylococcus felis]|uniref:Transcriptional regulator n=1 Tax=Staphylococcus felis TaxID=46127 RepID=A0A2K3Z9J3_9STAP|nr:helix-turn-helix transcriptional regulator [Staphylococcus felis]AVP37390.1 transcriptional regulator [Staphylococcus felis]MBH9580162.1 helix-turn-helix transcriptional regulator [Staphylococcus felis]MDM8327759.1 helix-turn-helix transcriptional regulator [Staphylococcus felis]MDQ7192945.1 helix-turn-helix transcriptional regulator [Staphylococcus felis]PNZ34543.1 transcriptional regulator [Staphylococcus felis]